MQTTDLRWKRPACCCGTIFSTIWQQRTDHPYCDFDDYLASFAADKRRKVVEAGIEIEALAGNAITPELWAQVHALYTATFDKYGNYPALSAQCLAEIGAGLGD